MDNQIMFEKMTNQFITPDGEVKYRQVYHTELTVIPAETVTAVLAGREASQVPLCKFLVEVQQYQSGSVKSAS